VTIRRGGRVTWRFVDDEVSHNVTSVGTPRFRSSATKLTGTYTVRFRRAGIYRYVCTIHANMRGKVIVR
jgi:plastocyanin